MHNSFPTGAGPAPCAADDDDDDVIRNHVFSDNIRISECGRHVEVVDRTDVNILKNLIQYTGHCVSKERPCFSINIKCIPEKDAFIMFGINSRCFIGNQMWAVDNSLRYHSNDGGVFNGGPGQKSDCTFVKGDTVTCYLDQLDLDRSLFLFIKNDRLVFRQWIRLSPHQLYATVGFKGAPITVDATWPYAQADAVHLNVKQDDLSQWLGFHHIIHDNDSKVLCLDQYDSQQRDAFCKTAPWPLTKKHNYFEMEILALQEQHMMPAIGIRDAEVQKFRLPGWDLNTIGYHGDMGAIFYGSGETCAHKDESLKCVQGDRQGCGLLFQNDVTIEEARSEISALIYFTKNDHIVFHTPIKIPKWGFYPTVGFCVKGEKVRLNMNAPPPKITKNDLKKMMKFAPTISQTRHHPAMCCTESHGRNREQITTVKLKDNEAKMLTCQYLHVELNARNRYFSAKIISIEREDSILQVGVATPLFPLENASLGKDKISCGYESKAGVVITSGVTSVVGKYSAGDVIGVYLEHISLTNGSCVVLFSKNGRSIGRSRMVIPVMDSKQEYDLDSSKEDSLTKSRRLLATVVLQKGPLVVEATWPGENVKAPKYQMSDVSTWVMTKDVMVINRQVLVCKPIATECHWQIAQACVPFLKEGHSFLEVTVQKSASDVLPCVGVTRHQPLRNVQMGARSDSGVGFYGHSPCLAWQGDSTECPCSHKCKIGDRIGVGIYFKETSDITEKPDQKIIVYFTKNGDIIQHVCSAQPKSGYYATISFPIGECEISVTVPSKPPTISSTLQELWVNDLEDRTSSSNTSLHIDNQIYQQLVSDVVNYTDFIIPKHVDGGGTTRRTNDTARTIPDSFQREHRRNRINRTSVYISHVLSDKDKACQLLDGLSQAGYIVEMSLWSNSESTQETPEVDCLIACLSDDYTNDSQIVAELESFSELDVPIIPIIVNSLPQWPPEGRIIRYQEFFLQASKYLLNFSCDTVNLKDVKRMLHCVENNVDPSHVSSDSKCSSKHCTIL